MSQCWTLPCFFPILCVLTGLICLSQCGLAIYLTFIQTDMMMMNNLIQTDRWDSYLFYILLVSIGLGFFSMIIACLSIYATNQRSKSFSLFFAVLWIFAMFLNLVMLILSILYYFILFPQLDSLLLRTLHQFPLQTSNYLDHFQTKYSCCGFWKKDEYLNLPLDPYPSSCCRIPNCWRDNDINTDISSNISLSLMHSKGILIGVTGLCTLIEFVIISIMLSLQRRFEESTDRPKFLVSHRGQEGSINTIDRQGSNETVEITQI